MGLVDDLSASVPTEEVSRRRVLGLLTTAAFGAMGAGTAITAVRFMRPNVLFEPATRFKLGRPEDYPVGTLLVMAAEKLYIVHDAVGFFALSATCTHLGCMTRYFPGENRIACPCHGSQFDEQGNVTDGPAPKPLERKELTLEGGQLVVDVRKTVPHDFVLKA